jgi:rhodanese-related sulfurtransferase
MENLNLPHPKQIDRAVPANMRCGEPGGEVDALDAQTWAPLVYTFAGIWEIEPPAYEEVASQVQLVDVREPDEYSGPLGHIDGARLIPLGELSKRSGEIDRDRPVVAVCRSGARSAQAVVLLQKAGFSKVANLAGGMLRWRASGHPVEDGGL